jgi:ferritin
MLSKKMEKALNKQINAEFYSSYLYLAMSADFETKNLAGCANWFARQAQEEWGHGMKMFKYINEQRGAVKLAAIDCPPLEWKSALDAFEAVLKHEQHVTELIHELMTLANEEKDYATQGFLQWFVKEQVEEEASADTIVQQLKMVGESAQGLFMLDRALAQRQ